MPGTDALRIGQIGVERRSSQTFCRLRRMSSWRPNSDKSATEATGRPTTPKRCGPTTFGPPSSKLWQAAQRLAKVAPLVASPAALAQPRRPAAGAGAACSVWATAEPARARAALVREQAWPPPSAARSAGCGAGACGSACAGGSLPVQLLGGLLGRGGGFGASRRLLPPERRAAGVRRRVAGVRPTRSRRRRRLGRRRQRRGVVGKRPADRR